MTGTLPNLALAQRVDQNGLPASGARLFIFEANTSTPVIAYKDYAMTAGMEQPHPIVADALGLIPMFWLPDGFYRARLEDRYGTPLIDEPVLPAVGTGEVVGEPGEPIAPAAIQWSTGDFLWQPVQGVRPGWARANGLTLGNAVSGASERANADCANLFSFLWNSFPNEMCPVLGGRGASGAADFTAGKQILMLDMRGFGAIGLDGMGNVSSGRFTDVPVIIGGFEQPGSWIGYNHQVMTTAQMPYHAHNAVTFLNITLGDTGHFHTYTGTGPAGSGVAAGAGGTITTNNTSGEFSGVYVSSATASTGIEASGGNAAQNNVSHVVPGSWYVRL